MTTSVPSDSTVRTLSSAVWPRKLRALMVILWLATREKPADQFCARSVR